VGIYLDFRHEFAVAWKDEKTLPECGEQAGESLHNVIATMEDIITYVRSRIYPNG
jgi:hypothetical protein